MKYYTLIISIFVASNCQGQDTAKNSNRSSISLTCGTNIVYPTTKQFQEIISYPGYYSNFEITPITTTSPWVSFTYNYSLRSSSNVSFSLNFGLAYLQYNYKSIEKGYLNDLGSVTYVGDSGAFKDGEKINVFEPSIGISVNTRIKNKFSWNNEIEILAGSNAFYDMYSSILSQFFNGGEYYIYLFYQTGINIQLSRKFDIMPECAFPLFNVSTSDVTRPISQLTSSFRTGITLTYNFNKK